MTRTLGQVTSTLRILYGLHTKRDMSDSLSPECADLTRVSQDILVLLEFGDAAIIRFSLSSQRANIPHTNRCRKLVPLDACSSHRAEEDSECRTYGFALAKWMSTSSRFQNAADACDKHRRQRRLEAEHDAVKEVAELLRNARPLAEEDTVLTTLPRNLPELHR